MVLAADTFATVSAPRPGSCAGDSALGPLRLRQLCREAALRRCSLHTRRRLGAACRAASEDAPEGSTAIAPPGQDPDEYTVPEPEPPAEENGSSGPPPLPAMPSNAQRMRLSEIQVGAKFQGTVVRPAAQFACAALPCAPPTLRSPPLHCAVPCVHPLAASVTL
jgi:hypothetical protein